MLSLAFVVAIVQPAALRAQRAMTPAPAAESGGVTVSGSVFDAYAGVSPEPTAVILTKAPDAAGPLMPFRRAPVERDRTFAFEHVPAGSYRVMLELSGDFKTRVIDVGTTNVSGVTLPVVGQTDVVLHVRMDDGGAVPDAVWFRAQAAGQGLTGGLRRPPADTILKLPPGKTPMFLLPPPGYFVRSIKAGAIDLFRQLLDVPPAARPIGVDVVISRTPPSDVPTVTVGGRVTGDHPDIAVQLEDTTALRARGKSFQTRTASDGAFEFADIPPGVYSLNLPPARDVVTNITAVGTDVRVDVPVPPGRVFAGLPVRIVDPNGNVVFDWPGQLSLVFGDADHELRFALLRNGSWGALAPNVYPVRIAGLPARFVVKSLTAGATDLLRNPFVVLPDRAPDRIAVTLQTTGSAPP